MEEQWFLIPYQEMAELEVDLWNENGNPEHICCNFRCTYHALPLVCVESVGPEAWRIAELDYNWLVLCLEFVGIEQRIDALAHSEFAFFLCAAVPAAPYCCRPLPRHEGGAVLLPDP
jgi:hypothetical protein